MGQAIEKRKAKGVLVLKRIDRYERPVFFATSKNNPTIGQREKRMVFADPNIAAGMVTGTALADDNITARGQLATENFDTKPFAFGFAAVFGRTYTIFVSPGFVRYGLNKGGSG